jgi:hypothetical protein
MISPIKCRIPAPVCVDIDVLPWHGRDSKIYQLHVLLLQSTLTVLKHVRGRVARRRFMTSMLPAGQFPSTTERK